jgi:hypothetical protein
MAVGLTTKPNLPFGELTTYELYLLMALMGLEVGEGDQPQGDKGLLRFRSTRGPS